MIIYFGNILSDHGYTTTFNEQLGPHLGKYSKIVMASNKKNPILRMLHMFYIFFVKLPNIKLILIDCYSSKAFYYCLGIVILSKLFFIPYIPILRGGNLPIRLNNNRWLSSFIFSSSEKNISPSLYLKEEFIKCGYKVEFIPNFIDIKNYSFKIRANCKPKLLWVRSIHKIYNPLMAINVLSKLIKIYPNAILCMVGPDKDGSLKLCKELSVNLGIDNNITFTGLLSKSEWISLSKKSDIFINTTDFDNMPVSVIEAMALGLPIVSTNAGGLKYLHKDGKDALLVDKNDVEEMVNKIKNIIQSNDLARTLSKNGREKAELFTWENVKDKWKLIIQNNG
tara:strand:- start:254 stop:1267 length:1014 start_codon:yes stop_codon:yes gene_type:complete